MICISCKTAISPQYIAPHTRKEQASNLGGVSLKDIKNFIAGYTVATLAEAVLPTSPIPSITGLAIQSMFKCQAPVCGKILATEKNMKVHLKTHTVGTKYIAVLAQAFSKNTHSAWFEVTDTACDGKIYPSPAYIYELTPYIDEYNMSGETQELLDMIMGNHEAVQKSNMQESYQYIQPAQIETSSPWIMFTGWTTHLQGLSRPDLAELAYLPNFRYGTYPPFERALNEACIKVFIGLYDAPNGLSKNILEWANSPDVSNPARYPLRHTQDISTWTLYCNVWRRMLLYIARVYMGCKGVQKETREACIKLIEAAVCSDQTGIRRPVLIEEYIRDWVAVLKSEGDIDQHSLLLSTRELMMAMVMQVYGVPMIYTMSDANIYIRAHQDFDFLLIHCMSILSIGSETKAFLPVGDYTRLLAGASKISRFISVYSVFVEPYSDPNADISQQYKEYRRVHKQHLVNGSQSPMDIILRWLKYGLATHRDTQKEGDFIWLEDMSILCHEGKNIPLESLPTFGCSILARLESLVTGKLTFGFDALGQDYTPLSDNISNSAFGFSFLTLDANQIYFTPSSRRILEAIILGPDSKRWIISQDPPRLNPTSAKIYLKLFALMQDILMVGIFTLCGQPPRIKELLSAQLRNTDVSRRNLFIYGKDLVITSSYHKGASQYGTQKIIPRFFPARLAQVMFAYIYFIRPFAILCQEHAGIEPTLAGSLIWPSKRDTFDIYQPRYLTTILKRYTKEYMACELTARQYRQVSIKIDMDIIRTPLALIEDQDNNSGSGSEADDDIYHTLQAGHNRKTERNNYGVDISQHMEVQRSVWSQYKSVSWKWHNFLGLTKGKEKVYIVCAS